MLMPHTAPIPLGEGDDATPQVPQKQAAPVPFDVPEFPPPDDATRPIRRKSGPARPEPEAPDDSTRQIPRKTGSRPAHQEEDATRHIPRKTGARPALQEEDDATRQLPRKSGPRPAPQEAAPPVRNPARKSGSLPTVTRAAPVQEAPLPWEAQGDDLSRLPTRAQPLPPIAPAPQKELVYPPEGPPVLVPVNTEPHFLAQAPKVQLVTQPHYVPPPPLAHRPAVVLPPLAAPPSSTASAPQPSGEPSSPEELRTTFSNKAAMVADLVKATFARRSYGLAPYRLRIDEPDGPSTAGGLHARQPLSLVSNLDSVPALVVGWVDVAKKESQLRSYGVVKRRHQSRHTTPLEISEEEYESFFNELMETLSYGGIRIVVQVPDEEPLPAQGSARPGVAQAPPQRRGRSPLGTLLLLLVTFTLGVGVGMNSELFATLAEQVQALLSSR